MRRPIAQYVAVITALTLRAAVRRAGSDANSGTAQHPNNLDPKGFQHLDGDARRGVRRRLQVVE
jgi:hypothetical protein